MWKPTVSSDELYHSAKGTTWKNHKYLKKIGNTYVYAKNAYKMDRKANAAMKKFKKQLEDNQLNSKEVESAIVNRRIYDGKHQRIGVNPKHDPINAYGQNSLYNALPGRIGRAYRKAENDKQDAATTFLNKEKYERTSRTFKNMAKKEASSIGQELARDAKSTANETKRKVKKLTKSAKKTGKKTITKARKALKSVKSSINNLKKKLNSTSKTRITVTSNLMPAGTKKDITNKYNHTTSKKKKRG